MLSLSELRLIMEQEISNIQLPVFPENLYKPIKYILSLEAKRMRPILLLMAHQLFDQDIKKAINPAIGIEFFHNFSLVHDDFMDEALLRRGKKTVHSKWDKNIAILSGDTMLVNAYQFVIDVEPSIVKEVSDVFSRSAIQVCEGQQLDLDFEDQSDVTISDYLRMIEYKTSTLLSAALKIGGITSHASQKDQKHLSEFGKNMGIGFQLKDDLLDLFGQTSSFGKKIGGDIIANKKTFLYLKSLEISNNAQYDQLVECFKVKMENKEKIDTVKSIFIDLNIPRLTMELIKKYHIKAMKHLNAIQSDNKQPLFDFSELLLDRVS